MTAPARIIRLILNLGVLLVFLLHVTGTFRLPVIDQFERMAYDLRLNLHTTPEQDERVVIANIDEKSLAEIGQWPWNRSTLAGMVDTLFEHYGIERLGFDMVFAEPDRDQGVAAMSELAQGSLRDNTAFREAWESLRPELNHDHRFAESMRGRDVVLGYVFNQNDDRQQNVLPDSLMPVPESLRKQLPLLRPRGYTGNLPMLQEAALTAGNFDNPAVDPDGVYRRVPVIQQYNGELYDSLALAMARLELGDPPLGLDLAERQNYRFIDALNLGQRRIPMSENGTVLVPYQGAQGSFPYVSIIDILQKKVPKEKLAGKMVLVGTTAPGLQDLRTTPVGRNYPGVEVHANLITGILDGNLLRKPGWLLGVEFMLLLILGPLISYLTQRFSPLISLSSVLGVAAGLIAINFHVWQAEAIVLPLTSPLLLIAAIFVLQTSFGLIMENRNKRMLAHLFGQYVPPELVDEMAERPEPVSIEGESRELTVLFSDVRGFTSISEGLDPKELTSLMNELLTPMTGVIHQYRGTIDKYMGDAIMAFWGAPLEDPNHADHAVAAGLAMIDGLQAMNADFARRGWPAVDIGVGLNTGVMSVGNMGSQFRMAYTVMGDAVNLGSRLEGLTKNYGVRIIASENTRVAAPGFAYRELDRVRVKGKDEPVTIFEPIDRDENQGEDTRERLDRFHQALHSYRQQEWDRAERLLRELQEQEPERVIYGIYLERIRLFREDPPPADWDGVFTHTEK